MPTSELEAENAVLEERLAGTPDPPEIRVHPKLAGLYREKVAALEEALGDPAIKAETVEIIRSPIERITLTPSAKGTLDIHLYGDQARILQFCEAGERKDQRPGGGGPGRGWAVVAGARNHLYRTFMAWTPYGPRKTSDRYIASAEVDAAGLSWAPAPQSYALARGRDQLTST